MSGRMSAAGKPYKTLEYLVYHPNGLNAYAASRMWDELALHSTISALRHVHGVDFICSFPISSRRGRPLQYFILPSDIPRARHFMRERISVPVRVTKKTRGGTDAIES
jgi:hypothetical protein